MSLGIRVSGRIGRPVAEVFDAVVNPKKLSSYFTTIGGASAPLVKGTTVTWWKDAPVEVVELVPESRIVLRWDGGTGEDEARYKTLVEMNFKPLEDGGTLVTIAETGWREDNAGFTRHLSQLRRLDADALLHEGFCRIWHQSARGHVPQRNEG